MRRAKLTRVGSLVQLVHVLLEQVEHGVWIQLFWHGFLDSAFVFCGGDS